MSGHDHDHSHPESRSCRRATELLSARQDRPLSRGERWQLRLHLLVCAHCRRFGRQLRALRDLVRAAEPSLEGATLDAAAKARLRAATARGAGPEA